ncbi:MAG: tetratricopeptide repeat protein, partial [Pseudomonadota bacterium]
MTPKSIRFQLLGLVTLGFTLAVSGQAYAAGGGGGGSLPSQSAPQIDPVQAYQNGVAYYRAGDYKKAERLLKQGVRAARKDANMHYALGLSQFAQEKYKPARRAFEKAVKYNPDLDDARAKLGLIYLQNPKTVVKADEQLAALD